MYESMGRRGKSVNIQQVLPIVNTVLVVCAAIGLGVGLGVRLAEVSTVANRADSQFVTTVTSNGTYTLRWDNGVDSDGTDATYEIRRVQTGQFNYSVLVLNPPTGTLPMSTVDSTTLEVVANTFVPSIEEIVLPYFPYSATTPGLFHVSTENLAAFDLECVTDGRCFFTMSSEEGYMRVTTGPFELTTNLNARSGNVTLVDETLTIARPFTIQLPYLN